MIYVITLLLALKSYDDLVNSITIDPQRPMMIQVITLILALKTYDDLVNNITIDP